jgi:hypothetical protein
LTPGGGIQGIGKQKNAHGNRRVGQVENRPEAEVNKIDDMAEAQPVYQITYRST